MHFDLWSEKCTFATHYWDNKKSSLIAECFLLRIQNTLFFWNITVSNKCQHNSNMASETGEFSPLFNHRSFYHKKKKKKIINKTGRPVDVAEK